MDSMTRSTTGRTPVWPQVTPLTTEYIPRLTIAHDEGRFLLNDFPVEPNRLYGSILLGLVRQRNYVDWDAGGVRRCQSLNGNDGLPTDKFPWEESAFKSLPKDLQVVGTKLPCEECNFKNWTPPEAFERRSKAPRCVEQFVVPLIIPDEMLRHDGTPEAYRLCVATFHKSSMKPTMEYLKQYRDAGVASYTKTTHLRLNVNLGSGFKYSVPTFAAREHVDTRAYPELSRTLAQARDILMRPPAPRKTASGGLLSVSETTDPVSGYTGSFFS